jgi:hypothetical protein
MTILHQGFGEYLRATDEAFQRPKTRRQ